MISKNYETGIYRAKLTKFQFPGNSQNRDDQLDYLTTLLRPQDVITEARIDLFMGFVSIIFMDKRTNNPISEYWFDHSLESDFKIQVYSSQHISLLENNSDENAVLCFQRFLDRKSFRTGTDLIYVYAPPIDKDLTSQYYFHKYNKILNGLWGKMVFLKRKKTKKEKK